MYLLTNHTARRFCNLCLLLVTISLLICFNFNIANTSDRYFEEDLSFIKPYNQQYPHFGVKGVPYTISPAEHPNLFLKYNYNVLTLNNTLSPFSTFIFDQVENERHQNFFKIRSASNNQTLGYNIDSPYDTGSRKEDICYLYNVDSRDNFSFQLRFGWDVSRCHILIHNLNTYKVNIFENSEERNKSYFWILRPVCQFPDLNIKEIDPASLLFKFPKKISLFQSTLSFSITPSQLQALYKIRTNNSEQEKLTIVYEDNDHIYASTPHYSYHAGIFISSGSFPLKIFHLNEFKIAKGETQQLAKAKVEINYSSEPIEVTTLGQYLYIEPLHYAANSQNKLSLLGNIEFKPGNAGIGLRHPSYNMTVTSVRDLIIKYNKRALYNDFVVEIKGNMISLTPINGNIATNLGNLMYGMNLVTDQIIERASQQSYRVIDRLATGMENHGSSIEKAGKSLEVASQNAAQALITVSNDFSKTIQYCFTSLNNTLASATATFDKAIETLSLTTQRLTRDSRIIISTVLRDLEHVATFLNRSLLEASSNLREGAQGASQIMSTALRESSTALVDSSNSFEQAFNSVSNALNNSINTIERSTTHISSAVRGAAQDISNSASSAERAATHMSSTIRNLPADLNPIITRATESFNAGMNSIERAAALLHRTHHQVNSNVDVDVGFDCTIS